MRDEAKEYNIDIINTDELAPEEVATKVKEILTNL